jgi:hypothetical protein
MYAQARATSGGTAVCCGLDWRSADVVAKGPDASDAVRLGVESALLHAVAAAYATNIAALAALRFGRSMIATVVAERWSGQR